MTPLARVEAGRRDGMAIVAIHGEVDLSNAEDIAEMLYRAVPHAADGVVIDLSPLRYIDSRGVQLLMQLLERLTIRRQRARLVLPSTSPLYRVFEVLSVTSSPGVDATVQDAVDTLRDQSSAEHVRGDGSPPSGGTG